jgi:hypothetical protein
MNVVKEIERLNEKELNLGLHEKGSWHDKYKDSAYIFVGGLDYGLTEGDVLCVFSQYVSEKFRNILQLGRFTRNIHCNLMRSSLHP